MEKDVHLFLYTEIIHLMDYMSWVLITYTALHYQDLCNRHHSRANEKDSFCHSQGIANSTKEK